MFISVPFDELLHFIIAPGFQVSVGDDSVIPRLTLQPFPRQFRDAVFDLSTLLHGIVLTRQGPSTRGLWGLRMKVHQCAYRMQEQLEMKVLGGKQTTAQKFHLGCRHKEENDPAAPKIFILEGGPGVSTGVSVCRAGQATDLFPICWIRGGDEVLCDFSPPSAR